MKSQEIIKAAISLKYKKKFLPNEKVVITGTAYANGAVLEREVVYDDVKDEQQFKEFEGYIMSDFLHSFYCEPQQNKSKQVPKYTGRGARTHGRKR